MGLTLMYITNQLDVALIAEKYGVERIWVDLETLGKAERQKNMDTVQSQHKISDIRLISSKLTTSEMLVRVNPLNDSSKQEIEQVIASGADLIMLPMWRTKADVSQFIDFVGGRAKVVLLLETKEAFNNLDSILTLNGIDEIHIGLNDLHLDMGLTFMFELLTNGVVAEITQKLNKAKIPYGFGGIARLGLGELPAEMIVKEHYRLGSTRAILSRSFCNAEKVTELSNIEDIFRNELRKLREFEENLSELNDAEFEENFETMQKKIDVIVRNKKK
ncbi:TPA: aldolase [Streptococcus suis]|uniref:aldolase/citrate lyase family protein n=1 Tax=Streptococcus TaxID=1301 RepID=UPI000CF505D3|nr:MULTISPECIES: aldolase/citrate lyase family protein [Streptococcus]MBM7136550.1 aldolase [Streptococcus suis]MBY0731484.1 aldolase [Streptococcus sp. 2018162]MCL4881301.1 HpcH/HpaI aldolase/citrate lyase family protein [Streptococcus suis]MCL4943098.1 HpcH/HpaI aldolase/citrate lyase family protein [Streptococcus suis]MCO8177560.1 HpcH/HpaI aldolase/citrate lyase family protein [Streptococcus suis]